MNFFVSALVSEEERKGRVAKMCSTKDSHTSKCPSDMVVVVDEVEEVDMAPFFVTCFRYF